MKGFRKALSTYGTGSLAALLLAVLFLVCPARADSAIAISCVFYYVWLHLQFVREHEEALKAGQRILMPGMRYQNYAIRLNPGDAVFVYTDGVPEANNAEDELYTIARMELALNQVWGSDPQSVLKGVREDVDAFECATYMYKTACIPDIERDFQQTLAQCRRVTPESIKREALSYKIIGQLAQFIAPLM